VDGLRRVADEVKTLLLLLVVLALAGCDMGACTLNIVPAVEVEVRDRVTNQYLAVTPRGVAREGSYADSLRDGGQTLDVPPRTIFLIGADERPGRYVVAVAADGYEPWDTAGVQAHEDDCHVRTARFTAALQPAP
jgi:uncharacterized lipoprotein YajG